MLFFLYMEDIHLDINDQLPVVYHINVTANSNVPFSSIDLEGNNTSFIK